MKKRLFVVLSLVCAMLFAFSFAGCDFGGGKTNNKGDSTQNGQTDGTDGSGSSDKDSDKTNGGGDGGNGGGGSHTHSWGEWSVTKEANCTEAGSRERICSECDEKATEEIPAGHTFFNAKCIVCNTTQYITSGLDYVYVNLGGQTPTYSLSSLGSSTATDIYIPKELSQDGHYNVRVTLGDGRPFAQGEYGNEVAEGRPTKGSRINTLTIATGVRVPKYGLTGLNNLKTLSLSSNGWLMGSYEGTMHEFFCEPNTNYRYADDAKLPGLTQVSKDIPGKANGSIVTFGGYYMPSSLTMLAYTAGLINDGMFANMKTLETIVLPEELPLGGPGTTFAITSSMIGKYAFWNCTALKEITLPTNTTKILWDAFDGCTSLATITSPATVTEIGDYAFKGCTALKEIKFGGTQTQWNAIGGSNWKNAIKGCKVTFSDDTSITIS